jgi:hypothetical protein
MSKFIISLERHHELIMLCRSVCPMLVVKRGRKRVQMDRRLPPRMRGRQQPSHRHHRRHHRRVGPSMPIRGRRKCGTGNPGLALNASESRNPRCSGSPYDDNDGLVTRTSSVCECTEDGTLAMCRPGAGPFFGGFVHGRRRVPAVAGGDTDHADVVLSRAATTLGH